MQSLEVVVKNGGKNLPLHVFNAEIKPHIRKVHQTATHDNDVLQGMRRIHIIYGKLSSFKASINYNIIIIFRV